MTKDQLERETLGWLSEVGWHHRFGPFWRPTGARRSAGIIARWCCSSDCGRRSRRSIRRFRRPPYQRDGETRGDFVRLVGWTGPQRNEWLAVNQFSITGPRHTRRPDIILFVNGLPLVLIELKNPADHNADVWKAFDQITAAGTGACTSVRQSAQAHLPRTCARR